VLKKARISKSAFKNAKFATLLYTVNEKIIKIKTF